MAAEAMQRYGRQIEEASQVSQLDSFRKSYPWRAETCKEAIQVSAKELYTELDAAQDSVEQDVPLCSHCRLPLGEWCYDGKDGSKLHGECLAQIMLQDAKAEQEARQETELAEKKAKRAQYDIGWKIERVPRNLGPLGKLGFKDIPAGAAVCLVFDEQNHSVKLAPTMEPAAAVNLEYLSLALKVRMEHGREPLFSLDAVDATQTNSMQKKVFEPAWLEGTSVGEVMFQADYHLKELSMGEYTQPVVGMKSCFDFADIDGIMNWSAREWFVVRKAEIQTTDDDVLIPYVKMGVEAREQVLKDGALVDSPLTRPNHPLVKYAEQFTHNFDLIAERKSVVYHLRELAKASILAKYLVDSGMRLDSSWFDLAGEAKSSSVVELPQLWNERTTNQVQMEDGNVVDCQTSGRNVFGGVDFGLDRFSVAAPRVGAMGAVAARLGPRAAARVGPMGRAPSLTFGGPARAVAQSLSGVAGVSGSLRAVAGPSAVFSGRSAMAPRVGGFAPRLSGFAASRLTTPSGSLRAVAGPSAVFSGRSAMAPRLGGFAPRLSGFAASRLTTPQGVDLNLDNFSLSETTKVSQQAVAGSWGKSADDMTAVSSSFFKSIEESDSVFTPEDKNLLSDVFNPNLSDRRADEECFMAPDASVSHVAKLRSLVKEEEAVRQRRKEHFFSTKFVMGDAGSLFPTSWTSSFEIAAGRTPKKALVAAAGGVLTARPEYVAAADMFYHAMKSATPIFDENTEDGMRFRIYRIGTLEVRTTQEHNGEEVVGAAFSIRQAATAASVKSIADGEIIVKATEYVERSVRGGSHYYVVLETEEGSLIVTEALENGSAAWIENAEDVEDRNSLAKVIRSEECNAGRSVSQVKQGATDARRAYDCAAGR